MKRVYVLVCVVACVVIAGCKKAPPPPAMITPQATANVSVAYDKFKDSTRVSVGTTVSADDGSAAWSLLYDEDGQVREGANETAMHVSVAYEFPGRQFSDAREVFFDFDWSDSRLHGDVTFLLDGTTRIPLKKMGNSDMTRGTVSVSDGRVESSRRNWLKCGSVLKRSRCAESSSSALRSC